MERRKKELCEDKAPHGSDFYFLCQITGREGENKIKLS